jgi:hypothetical protein
MDDDMTFVEGTYRLPGGDWQVVIVLEPVCKADYTEKGGVG